MITNFKNKRKRNLWPHFSFYFGGILILFIFVILVIANIKIYYKRQEYLAQVANLQNQIKDIQQRNENLKQGISKADDNQYIEKVAREELDLQKPGEKVVSFVMSQTQSQETNNQPKNIWQKWLNNTWNWIKNKF